MGNGRNELRVFITSIPEEKLRHGDRTECINGITAGRGFFSSIIILYSIIFSVRVNQRVGCCLKWF